MAPETFVADNPISEEALDAMLAGTFPSSDPPAPTPVTGVKHARLMDAGTHGHHLSPVRAMAGFTMLALAAAFALFALAKRRAAGAATCGPPGQSCETRSQQAPSPTLKTVQPPATRAASRRAAFE